jgi:hypothetical protein
MRLYRCAGEEDPSSSSLYLPEQIILSTLHTFAVQTAYFSVPGDFTGARSIPAPPTGATSLGNWVALFESKGFPKSIYDKQRCSHGAARAVRLCAVRNLVAGPRLQNEPPSITQLGEELPTEDEQDVSALTPMVRYVSRRVLHHPNSNIPHSERSPIGSTRLTWMLGLRKPRPVRGGEAHVFNLQLVSSDTLIA